MTDGHNTESGAQRRGELCILAADGTVALSLKIVDGLIADASIEPPVVDEDTPVFTPAQEARILELVAIQMAGSARSIGQIVEKVQKVSLPEGHLSLQTPPEICA